MASTPEFAAAVAELSLIAPYSVVTEITPVAGVLSYDAPAGALMARTPFGVELSLLEFYTTATAATLDGWVLRNGKFLVTREATEAFVVEYLCAHQPDTDGDYPTLPAEHVKYVEMLMEARQIEAELRDTRFDPQRYLIGQTEFERGPNFLKQNGARAELLRQQVRDALGGVVVEFF